MVSKCRWKYSDSAILKQSLVPHNNSIQNFTLTYKKKLVSLMYNESQRQKIIRSRLFNSVMKYLIHAILAMCQVLCSTSCLSEKEDAQVFPTLYDFGFSMFFFCFLSLKRLCLLMGSFIPPMTAIRVKLSNNFLVYTA